MPGEIPAPQSPELITHAPTAEELQSIESPQPQTEVSDDTLTMEAYRATLAGEQGDAVDLNAQYPAAARPKARTALPPEPVNLPKPYEVPEHEQPVSREELRKIVAEIQKEQQA